VAFRCTLHQPASAHAPTTPAPLALTPTPPHCLAQSELFLNLKIAYDTLRDADQRRNYDAFHSSREYVRDRRPLSAKEAAWLVDQQKRSWGVREIHPFAVCILCESCPCPADGVCYACGMTFCQMCVRKMHTNGKTVPHYPCRNSTKFSEDLVVAGKEKDRERRMLQVPSNKWLLSDAEFGHRRDVYRERAKADAPEMCSYWAWAQTRYTVHLAVWLPSSDGNAEIFFDRDEAGKQRITLRPTGMAPLLSRTFAHEVDESRAGDAMFFQHMHCMTFCLAKANVGERWRAMFAGDADGAREMRLGKPDHSVGEEQVRLDSNRTHRAGRNPIRACEGAHPPTQRTPRVPRRRTGSSPRTTTAWRAARRRRPSGTR